MSKQHRITETASPTRNFTLRLDDRIRALGGPPQYMRRKREIEDLERLILAELRTRREKLEKRGVKDRVVLAKRLIEGGRDLNVGRLNQLIAKHNLYYPAEADLPVDVRTGELLERGRPWRKLEFCTVEDLVLRSFEPPADE